jgi:flagellar biosynthesis/type III secretory pathway chaperone
MDSKTINLIIIKETVALNKLLTLLETQHELLIKNNVQKLEELVEEMEYCNKEIAKAEVERRKEINGQSMKAIINASKDDELDKNFRAIQRLISEIQVQKETNDMLIKLGLGFSTRILKILNPDRKPKTYNSYGKLK